MQDKELKVLETFKSLVSQRTKVCEIRAFGSRARGDAAEYSDLDVFVVVDNLDHALEKYISECAWEAGFPEDIIVIPVSIGIDMLKNSPMRESAFIKNIYREGVAV